MLPNGIPSHHLQAAPRPTLLRRGRGAEVLHRAYKWSSILQVTKPRLPPDLFICGKFTARSTTTKCSSAGLLTDQAPLRCRAHCHWRRKRSSTAGGSSPRPGYAQCPYSTARLEANQLQQVPWPPSAAYAAGCSGPMTNYFPFSDFFVFRLFEKP